MISKKEWESENQYLQRVLEVINNDLEHIGAQRSNRAGELRKYRKYLWENRRDFNNLYEIAEYEDRLREDIRGYEAVSHRYKLLQKAYKMPYFGRIDFYENGRLEVDKLYIGLTSVINREKFDILVTDWRAPIASMYYEYEIGPASFTAPEGEISGNITLKRQFKIKDGQLILAVDTGIRIDDEILLETLSKSRSSHMQQIVYSIQREQNKIIRDRKSRCLWIQGVAGSGKTSIALHRIAYLLYHRRKHLRADSFIVFSPNQVFIDYISDVLPELGEENARQTTFYDCATKTLAQYNLQIEDISEQMEFLFKASSNDTRVSSARYKMSVAFSNVLKSYINYLFKHKWQFKDIIFAKRCVFTAKEAEYLFNVEYAHVPLNDRIEQVVNRIIHLVGVKYKKVNEEKLKLVIYDACPKINALTIYRRLFTDMYLWNDLKVQNMPSNISEICSYTIKQLNKGVLLYEDVVPLMYLQAYLEGLNIDGGVRHVVIDEVQDYSLLQLELIKAMYADADFTFLGDINQAIHPYNKWDLNIATSLFGDKCNVVKLNKCYRSTKEIADLASFILPQPGLEIIERQGNMPTLHISDANTLSKNIVEQIKRLQAKNHKSIAIIAKTLNRCRQMLDQLKAFDLEIKLITGSSRHFANGVAILPSYVSKGLEFDAVLIIDADEETYGGLEDQYLMYTLCTRALHELQLFATNPLTILQEANKYKLLKLSDARQSNVSTS